MSADEQVDIRATVDNAAALSLMEQLAGSLQKIADKGQEAGRKNAEGSGWAAKGLEDFAGQIEHVTSLGALADKVFEGINDSLKEMRERAKAAWEAQQEAAVGQRNWAELLPAGANPKDFQERLEGIAGATTARTPDVASAFAAALSGAGPKQTPDDALAAVAAAAGQSKDPGRMAELARQVQKFRVAFPEATAEGALAELSRHAPGEDFANRQLPALSELRGAGGGKDSYQFLERLMAGLGPRAGEGDVKALLRAARPMLPANLVEGGSIEEQFGFIRGAQGSQVRQQLFGGALSRPQMLDNPESAATLAGKLGLNRADPAVLRRLVELVAGRGEAAAAFEQQVPALNDPATIAAMRGQQARVAAQPLAVQEQARREAANALENFDVANPAGMVAQARAARDTIQQRAGRGLAGWRTWGAGINEIGEDLGTADPEVQLRHIRGQLRDSTITGVGPGSDPKLIAAFQGTADAINRMIESLHRERQKTSSLTIHSGGDEHHATVSPARAAGQ